MASGLSEQGDEAQVNTLIYAMGDEGDDILRSFAISADDRKVYETVKGKFDAHFVPRRNVIFERAKFNMRTSYSVSTRDTKESRSAEREPEVRSGGQASPRTWNSWFTAVKSAPKHKSSVLNLYTPPLSQIYPGSG